jgi:hypothetical protein
MRLHSGERTAKSGYWTCRKRIAGRSVCQIKPETREQHVAHISKRSRAKQGTPVRAASGEHPAALREKLTIERVDYLGFKTVNGETMIIKCPSADDGSAPRAETYISSPQNYDPNSDAPAPENTDPNVYIGWVTKVQPALTGTQTTYAGYATYTGFPNDGSSGPVGNYTFPVAAGYATAGEAIAAALAFVNSAFNQAPPPNGLGGFFRAPVSAKGFTTTFTRPAFHWIGGLNTGGFKPDPDNPPPDPVIKVKMGPLWWIRKIQNGPNSDQTV